MPLWPLKGIHSKQQVQVGSERNLAPHTPASSRPGPTPPSLPRSHTQNSAARSAYRRLRTAPALRVRYPVSVADGRLLRASWPPPLSCDRYSFAHDLLGPPAAAAGA